MSINILNNPKLMTLLVCFAMVATSWSAMFNFEQNTPDIEVPELESEQARMETNAPTVISFNTTWTAANSPYYLNSPVSVQQGVRLTIDPGVQVYANTTNSSITVHGEIHSLGTSANPVFIGVNPSVSWTSSSGYWGGIKAQNPAQGNDPLLMRNTTLSGPTGWWYSPGQSSGSSYTLMNFRYFFRTNAEVIIDNFTLQHAHRVTLDADTYAYSMSGFTIENLYFNNISMVRTQAYSNWYNSCNGNWWDELSFFRSSVYLDSPNYMSEYPYTSYCNPNGRPIYDGWTFNQSDVQIYAGSYWTTPTATNPTWYRGTFIDTAVELLANSGGTSYLELRDSNFTSTGSPTATAWQYSQYSHQRGTAFITADSSSYGKWTVANNTFAPTNGWTGIKYTYQNNRMEAPYNYWGSSNRTVIDGLIYDINDNSGGNWVNYCPFWTNPAMNTLTSNCTRTRVDFTSPANGSSQVGYNLTINYTHLMVSIGDWYLDNNSLETFNTSNNSITLTGLTMGWHQLCAQVSG
ncbi:MAG: hypothetical protein QF807_06845, partial [Candidatus Thalassarchaeaceae archaeon]|nr:hypothetical protein [Candidatus Thalassarchaeaceae archaeon]